MKNNDIYEGLKMRKGRIIDGDKLLQILREEKPEMPLVYIDWVETVMDRCKVED